jgi:hypothetical protein
MRTDAAEGCEVAVVAGAGRGVHARLPCQELPDEALEHALPGRLLRRPRKALGCRPQLRQQVRARPHAAEAHLAGGEVHGGERHDVAAGGGEVGEQLRVRGALAKPVGAAGAPALVVEDDPPLRHAVDAVEAHAHAPAAESELRHRLGRLDREGRAVALEGAQPQDQAFGAAALARQRRRQLAEQVELPVGRALAATAVAARLRGQGECGLRDGRADQGPQLRVTQARERSRILELRPQKLQRLVQERAALVRGDARLHGLGGGRTEAQLRVGAERAGILQGQRAGAGGEGHLRVEAQAATVLEPLGEARARQARRQPVPTRRARHHGQAGQQRAWQQLEVALAFGY